MCTNKSGGIFRVILWVCSWISESRHMHMSVLCLSSCSLCQQWAGVMDCNGGRNHPEQKEPLDCVCSLRAAGLKFGPCGLTVGHFIRIPGHRQGIFVPAKLPLQTGYAGLSSEHGSILLQEAQCQSMSSEIGVGCSPSLPCCIDLSLFPQKVVKKSHKEVGWHWQNMTTTVRGPVCKPKAYLYLVLISNDPSADGTATNNCSAVWANYFKLMHFWPC